MEAMRRAAACAALRGEIDLAESARALAGRFDRHYVAVSAEEAAAVVAALEEAQYGASSKAEYDRLEQLIVRFQR